MFYGNAGSGLLHILALLYFFNIYIHIDIEVTGMKSDNVNRRGHLAVQL